MVRDLCLDARSDSYRHLFLHCLLSESIHVHLCCKSIFLVVFEFKFLSKNDAMAQMLCLIVLLYKRRKDRNLEESSVEATESTVVYPLEHMIYYRMVSRFSWNFYDIQKSKWSLSRNPLLLIFSVIYPSLFRCVYLLAQCDRLFPCVYLLGVQ